MAGIDLHASTSRNIKTSLLGKEEGATGNMQEFLDLVTTGKS